MSDSEENAAPTTSSMVTDIVDKKGHSTSVVWRYFVFLQSDTVQTIRAIKNRQHYKPVSSFKTMSPFRTQRC